MIRKSLPLQDSHSSETVSRRLRITPSLAIRTFLICPYGAVLHIDLLCVWQIEEERWDEALTLY